jgi:hypothetical protein
MNAKKTVKSKGPGDVGEFMRELDHPLKRDIETVRRIILNVDPAGLLKWLAKDRCLVTLGVGKDIQIKRAAFEAIVREWIRWV